jgi:hypothetical protein
MPRFPDALDLSGTKARQNKIRGIGNCGSGLAMTFSFKGDQSRWPSH